MHPVEYLSSDEVVRFSNGVSVGISQCGWSNEIFDRAKKKRGKKKQSRNEKKKKRENRHIYSDSVFREWKTLIDIMFNFVDERSNRWTHVYSIVYNSQFFVTANESNVSFYFFFFPSFSLSLFHLSLHETPLNAYLSTPPIACLYVTPSFLKLFYRLVSNFQTFFAYWEARIQLEVSFIPTLLSGWDVYTWMEYILSRYEAIRGVGRDNSME